MYTAIQVCYNLDNSDGTFDREVNALLKKYPEYWIAEGLLIIARYSGEILEIGDRVIEVIPVWRWLLNIAQ